MSRCRCDHPGHPDWHNFDCPVDPPQLDPDEVREWLKDAAERRDLPSMPDNPERLMERILGLKATVLLRRLVELHDTTNSGLIDLNAWDVAWVEARALLGRLDAPAAGLGGSGL